MEVERYVLVDLAPHRAIDRYYRSLFYGETEKIISYLEPVPDFNHWEYIIELFSLTGRVFPRSEYGEMPPHKL
jgi:hypothetical protein